MKKILIALVIAGLMTGSVAPALAAETPDGMVVIADVLLVRPVSLAAVVIGSAMWVVALPFSIPSGSVGVASEALVAEPFRYTFTRPVGDFSQNRTYTETANR